MEKSPRPKIFFLRQLLVHRSCQFHLLLYNVLTILVTGGFFLGLSLTLQEPNSHHDLFFWILGGSFLVFVFLFLAGLWLSNKIVGPIYRMERHMEAIIKGEPSRPLQFRSGDHFHKTAHLYNQLIHNFEKQIGAKDE